MGLDIKNSLMVGVFYDHLEDWIESKVEVADIPHREIIEEYFDVASPYYDSDMEDWFIGFQIPNYCTATDEWFDEVKKVAEKFELLTGVRPIIRGGCHVY